MKKLILIMLTIMSVSLWSCGKSDTNAEQSDTIATTDTLEISGIAIDGAMNSVTIAASTGDTLSFSYPDLAPEKRYSWSTGDSITIKFVLIDDEPIVTELTSAAQ